MWGGSFPLFGSSNQRQKKYPNQITVGLKWPPMDGIHSNNQPTVRGSDRLDVGEETLVGEPVGGHRLIIGASNGAMQK
jgi:hypothetical protein